MAPQVGLEPTTLRLTGEIQPLHPTKPTNQTQQNNKKSSLLFASLWPVSVALHGQKTDRGKREKKNARCKTGVFHFPISGICRHPTWSAFMLAVASRDCLS